MNERFIPEVAFKKEKKTKQKIKPSKTLRAFQRVLRGSGVRHEVTTHHRTMKCFCESVFVHKAYWCQLTSQGNAQCHSSLSPSRGCLGSPRVALCVYWCRWIGRRDTPSGPRSPEGGREFTAMPLMTSRGHHSNIQPGKSPPRFNGTQWHPEVT